METEEKKTTKSTWIALGVLSCFLVAAGVLWAMGDTADAKGALLIALIPAAVIGIKQIPRLRGR